MLLARKIRLIPTPEQEILFWKSAGVARWSYNYFLAEQEKCYEQYLANNKEGPCFVKEGDVRKYINNVLKKTTHTWLKEVGSNVMKQGVKDADEAYRRFFNGLAERPRFKKKNKSKISFYVNYESLIKTQNGFRGEKIGYVKTSEPLPQLSEGENHYSNPRISYDGKYWYISVGVEIPDIKEELTEKSLGIDLGVKDLAICSDGKKYRNINKSKRVRKLEKKLLREQRKLSRMMLINTKEYETVGNKRYPVWIKPLEECRNIQKQNGKLRLLHKKLNDIRNNYIHQTTSEIVKTKPSRIVMEKLNVKGMMKNKHLAKSVQQQRFYDFRQKIQYKAALRGIEFVEADIWYPSSKMCSCCGNIRHDLKLSDRVYRCNSCGLEIDRDYNASINLANYQSA